MPSMRLQVRALAMGWGRVSVRSAAGAGSLQRNASAAVERKKKNRLDLKVKADMHHAHGDAIVCLPFDPLGDCAEHCKQNNVCVLGGTRHVSRPALALRTPRTLL